MLSSRSPGRSTRGAFSLGKDRLSAGPVQSQSRSISQYSPLRPGPPPQVQYQPQARPQRSQFLSTKPPAHHSSCTQSTLPQPHDRQPDATNQPRHTHTQHRPAQTSPVPPFPKKTPTSTRNTIRGKNLVAGLSSKKDEPANRRDEGGVEGSITEGERPAAEIFPTPKAGRPAEN